MRKILAWSVLLTNSCILTASTLTHVDEESERVDNFSPHIPQIRGSFISLQEPSVPSLQEAIAEQPSQGAVSADGNIPSEDSILQELPPKEPAVKESTAPSLQEEIAEQPSQGSVSADGNIPSEDSTLQELLPKEPAVKESAAPSLQEEIAEQPSQGAVSADENPSSEGNILQKSQSVEPAVPSLQVDSTDKTSLDSQDISPKVPQIRGVIVPSESSASTTSNAVQDSVEVSPQIEDSQDRWPEVMRNIPQDPVASKPQIHGVVVPLQEASSVESTVVEAPVEKALQKEEAVVVTTEEKSAITLHSSPTLIFSAPDISSVKSIEIVSENREVKESKAKEEPIKRNVFANITIAALSAAVIFVSAILGSH